MDKLKTIVKDRKFLTAVATIVVVVAGAFGFGVTDDVANTIVDVLAAVANVLG